MKFQPPASYLLLAFGQIYQNNKQELTQLSSTVKITGQYFGYKMMQLMI